MFLIYVEPLKILNSIYLGLDSNYIKYYDCVVEVKTKKLEKVFQELMRKPIYGIQPHM